MRQRRLLVAGLIVVLVAAGATLALRGPGGSKAGPAGAGHATSSATVGNFSVSYPSAWKRVRWDCWTYAIPSYLLLTTARPTPTCGAQLPPRERLERDGVTVWFATAAPLRGRVNPSILWRPNPAPIGLWAGTERVTCAPGAGAPWRLGTRLQHGPYAVIGAAVICGPHYGRSKATLQRVLGNSFFTR
jgi:hypothetical protein